MDFDDNHRSAQEEKRLQNVHDRQAKVLKNKAIQKNKAAHKALVHAATHNQHPPGSRQQHHTSDSSVQHHDEIMQTMRKVASDKLEAERSRSATNRVLQPSSTSGGLPTSRKSSNVGFSNLYNRRGSLQVDNDPSYIYDSRTILRKNTAVNLSNVYDDFYRSHGSPPNSKGQRRQSSTFSPNERNGGGGMPSSGVGVVGIMTNKGPDLHGSSSGRRGSTTRFLPTAVESDGSPYSNDRRVSHFNSSQIGSPHNHHQQHGEGAVTIYPGTMDANMRRCSSAGINPVTALFSPIAKQRGDLFSHRKAMQGITAEDVQHQLKSMGFSEDPNSLQRRRQDQETTTVYSSLPEPLPSQSSPQQHRARSAGPTPTSRNDLPRMSTASYGNDLGYGFKDMAKRPSQRRRTPSTLLNKSKISYAELMAAIV